MSELSVKLAGIRRQHNLAGDYAMTLELLRALKAGEVKLEQVILIADGWNVIEAPAEEQTPAADLKLAEANEPPAAQ